MPPLNDDNSNEDEHFILDNGDIDIDKLRNNKATIKASDIKRTNDSSNRINIIPDDTNIATKTLRTNKATTVTTERSDEVGIKVFYNTVDWRTMDDYAYYNSDGNIFYDSKDDSAPDPSEPNKEETVSKKVLWKFLTETADGTPFVPQHKESVVEEPTAAEALADEHLLKTGTIIKQNHYLYLERADDGEIFYDEIIIHEDIDSSINIIAQSTDHCTACKGPLIIDLQTNSENYNSSKYMANPTIQESNSYNTAPRLFEHEYWMDHFGFDDAAIRLCHQGQIDSLADFNIYASDLDNI